MPTPSPCCSRTETRQSWTARRPAPGEPRGAVRLHRRRRHPAHGVAGARAAPPRGGILRGSCRLRRRRSPPNGERVAGRRTAGWGRRARVASCGAVPGQSCSGSWPTTGWSPTSVAEAPRPCWRSSERWAGSHRRRHRSRRDPGGFCFYLGPVLVSPGAARGLDRPDRSRRLPRRRAAPRPGARPRPRHRGPADGQAHRLRGRRQGSRRARRGQGGRRRRRHGDRNVPAHGRAASRRLRRRPLDAAKEHRVRAQAGERPLRPHNLVPSFRSLRT